VLAALADNHVVARQEFGRTVGRSRSSFFLVRGRGRIIAVEKSRVGIAFSADVDEAEMWLVSGPVFGNAVRDSTGLLRSQDFPNSQDFNRISAELNKLVEQRVQPALRVAAAAHQSIDFVACVEIPGGAVDQPLEMIPLAVAVE
jgi:predicted lipoprotein